MTDLSRLGEQLRDELGQPPAEWTKQQGARLRDIDLEPRSGRWQPLALAAVVLGGFLAFGAYHAVKPQSQGELANLPPPVALPQKAERAAPSRAVWLGAESIPTIHRLADASEIQLEAGARGRLDEGMASGTRFDLHEGTASFVIENQKGAEFSVVAGDYRVVVVGTRFTVGYVPPKKLSVLVKEGAVNVVLPERSQPVLVGAGEQLTISGDEFSLTGDTDVSTDEAISDDAISGTSVEQNPDSAKASPSDGWKELYAAGKYEAACATLGREGLIILQKQLSAADLIDLSSALRLCGKTGDALGTLDTLRRRYAGSAQASDALFLMGRIHATAGKPDVAISYLKQYVESGDGARFAPEALGRLIEIHISRGQQTEAQKYARRYLAAAPHGPYQRLAESVVEKH